jgi:hypothetical protein
VSTTALEVEFHGEELEEEGSSRGKEAASMELGRDGGRLPLALDPLPVWSSRGREGGHYWPWIRR